MAGTGRSSVTASTLRWSRSKAPLPLCCGLRLAGESSRKIARLCCSTEPIDILVKCFLQDAIFQVAATVLAACRNVGRPILAAAAFPGGSSHLRHLIYL